MNSVPTVLFEVIAGTLGLEKDLTLNLTLSSAVYLANRVKQERQKQKCVGIFLLNENILYFSELLILLQVHSRLNLVRPIRWLGRNWSPH